MGKGVISVYTNRVANKFNNIGYTTNASNLDDELKTLRTLEYILLKLIHMTTIRHKSASMARECKRQRSESSLRRVTKIRVAQ